MPRNTVRLTEPDLEFARWLRERRLAAGFTMQEFAGRLGISSQFISFLEGGHRRPSDKLVRRCAEEFGEDLNYLRFLANPMPGAERQALLESPSAPEFLRRHVPDVKPYIEGSDDILIQEFLGGTRPFRPDNEFDVDIYFTGYRPIQWLPPLQWSLVEMIRTDRERFGANVVAWAEFHSAFYWVCLGDRQEPYQTLLKLHERLRLETAEAYPLKLRFLVAFHLTLLEGTKGLQWKTERDLQATERFFQEALGYAKAVGNRDWEQLVLRLRWRVGLKE